MKSDNIKAQNISINTSEILQQSMVRTQEIRRTWDTIIKNALIKMNDVGWTLPMVMGIQSINYISKLETTAEIDNFFVQYFSHDNNRNFNELILDIQDSKIEEKYKTAVQQCVYAYNKEWFIIVADTLVTVIEGLLSFFCTDKNNIRMIKICKDNIEKLIENKDEDDPIKKFSWESYLSFITKLYSKSKFSESEPDFINRHWLLHGRSSYEVTKADCLRLFNAISTICYIVDKNTTN